MFDPHASAGFMVNLVARMFERQMAADLRPLGLKAAYLPVLFTLAADGEAHQSKLVSAAVVDQSTMALTLKRMQRDGLVTAEPDAADRRRSIYRLTDTATSLMPRVEAIANEINDRALRAVDGDTLFHLIDAIARNLGREADVASFRPPPGPPA